uniref:cyclin-dependent kinase n=1 Tax=Pithovirus LCPAC102 TaxID=2506587 RepID=A0A481Z340_9VIRU|nr:MAG: putative serine/threonine protein kinase [Pithovirus LCPAC102]
MNKYIISIINEYIFNISEHLKNSIIQYYNKLGIDNNISIVDILKSVIIYKGPYINDTNLINNSNIYLINIKINSNIKHNNKYRQLENIIIQEINIINNYIYLLSIDSIKYSKLYYPSSLENIKVSPYSTNINVINNEIFTHIYIIIDPVYNHLNIIKNYKILEITGILSSTDVLKYISNKDNMWIQIIHALDKIIGDDNPTVLFLAISYFNNIIDEYISRNLNEEYILNKYGIACLILAIKMESIYNLHITELLEKIISMNIDIFSNISIEDINEIKLLEKKCYDILNHRLIHPTTMIFYNFIVTQLKYIKSDISINTLEINYIKFLLFIINGNTSMNIYNPSIIAVSCIYLGRWQFSKNWDDDYSYISGYTATDIFICCNIISFLINNLILIYTDITQLPDIGKNLALKKYIKYLERVFDINILLWTPFEYTKYNLRSTKIYKRQYNNNIDLTISLNDITILNKLGGGSYGVVYKSNYKNKTNALKIAYCNNGDIGIDKSILREISILKFISNPYIINIIDVVYNLNENDDINVDDNCYGFMMNIMDTDLHHLLKTYRESNTHIDMHIIQKFTHQLLQGINYLHNNSILHRDLKPINILIKNGNLKIADLGLGRSMVYDDNRYTFDVVTLWYRAPELLIGKKIYGFKIDMWSCGCIIGEMRLLNPLFPGGSELSVLSLIIKFLGTDKFKELQLSKLITDDVPPKDLNILFGLNDIVFIQLLKGLLEPNPNNRYSSHDALLSPWISVI